MSKIHCNPKHSCSPMTNCMNANSRLDELHKEPGTAGIDISVTHLWQSNIEFGEELLHQLTSLSNCQPPISNIAKLVKKIEQELRFLCKQSSQLDGNKESKQLDILACTNLRHLSSIVSALREAQAPCAVLQTFHYKEQTKNRKLVVDVVSGDGHRWVKVVARNARALDLNARGGQQFGQRSVLEQIKEFKCCAAQNPKLFRTPEIVFDFRSGISRTLANRIERKGVVVLGQRIAELHNDDDSDDDDDDDDDSEDDEIVESIAQSNGVLNSSCLSLVGSTLTSSSLNLDVTAMIAYVSALTNGHCNLVFSEPILTAQALRERLCPAKPFLDNLMSNTHLVCCQSAMRDFRAIVDTLGGIGEKQRASALVDRVQVVPDQMSKRLEVLDRSAKIKTRSKAIFGTGDTLCTITLSANSGFVRAAKGQGIDVAVIIHESRALTEAKMAKAKPITTEE